MLWGLEWCWHDMSSGILGGVAWHLFRREAVYSRDVFIVVKASFGPFFLRGMFVQGLFCIMDVE